MIPLKKATTTANEIVQRLAPHCERIAIAGSIRRKKSQVKDIEIVCIPKQVEMAGQIDLFGTASPLMVRDPEFMKVIDSYGFVKGKSTGRYMQRTMANNTVIDFFVAEPDTWGYILLLRTGSKGFNINMINYMKRRNYHCREGKVFFRDRPVAVRQEEDMFRFAGIMYQHPEQRNAKLANYYTY